jgi:threonine dehydrogenase-like Zn-dependent dehydrogenase
LEYAQVPDGGTLVVLGLGPIGSMACRIAAHRNRHRVIGIDLVTDRLDRARPYCDDVIDLRAGDVVDRVQEQTDGRGADAVLDAVGMEAHGSPVAEFAQTAAGFLPSPVGRAVMRNAGMDRLAALHTAIALVRRGGTISLSGVYGGAADPINMMVMFDKQLQLRMGQANVKRWIPDIMPLLTDGDPLGVDTFATHRLPLSAAPQAYETFQKKADGMIKVVLKP